MRSDGLDTWHRLRADALVGGSGRGRKVDILIRIPFDGFLSQRQR